MSRLDVNWVLVDNGSDWRCWRVTCGETVLVAWDSPGSLSVSGDDKRPSIIRHEGGWTWRKIERYVRKQERRRIKWASAQPVQDGDTRSKRYGR